MEKTKQIASCFAISALLSFPAQADIAQEPALTEAFVPLAMAAELADNCENTTLKRMDGVAYRAMMQDKAVSLGYSEAEFDAFINDPDAFERARETAQMRLADLGVVQSGENDHCLFGLNEITEDTQLGRLIFMW